MNPRPATDAHIDRWIEYAYQFHRGESIWMTTEEWDAMNRRLVGPRHVAVMPTGTLFCDRRVVLTDRNFVASRRPPNPPKETPDA